MNRTALRAALTVAATYGFFLIFAQFSFVELLRSGGVGLGAEKAVLGTMAVAGIAGGFFSAWRGACSAMIRVAMGLAALVSALAPFFPGAPACFGIALVTGAALGIATVGLAAWLPAWCGVFWVGLGTGLGYALCNLPAVFLQSPSVQAWIGAGFAMVAALAVPASAAWPETKPTRVFPVWATLALFTALVWMDSAAFFIIQHSGDLKSGTWGAGLLWRNAAVHLGGACVAGWWLSKGGARSLPGTAWLLLAVAALAVNQDANRWVAGWFYPAGVSLYSTALVAWPGWFSGVRGPRPAAWRAAWLFAIAGWFGSANGIGMAQTLRQVPPWFVAGAGAVIAGAMILSHRKQWKPALAVLGVVLTGWSFSNKTTPQNLSAAERGRQVYLSEGCIHCHSQYVRPGSTDEDFWGPAKPLQEVLKDEPVLIGNRRQGPDLRNIGTRRSETWLKLHFLNPRELTPGSAMPSYAHLFEDGRGQDLVAYLRLLGIDGIGKRIEQASTWEPEGSADGLDGAALFANHCRACHGASGGGKGPLSWHFSRPPANLTRGPFIWTAPGDDLDLRIARVIKFGIPGTDMPGHETLSDAEVLALKNHVLDLR